MPSTIEVTGFIEDGFSFVTGGDDIEADFTLVDMAYRFQVITKAQKIEGFTEGDHIRIIGKLRESGGDMYIYATSIELKNQGVMTF